MAEDKSKSRSQEPEAVRSRGLQPDQQLPERTTTRVPRGAGEPAADALSDEPGVRATQHAVRQAVQEENERGYRGQQTDPTPNENYTVAGVTSGKPTPETTIVTPRGR